MRYRLAALMLFAVLPVSNALAAPAPETSAILEIGPPPKGEKMDKYLKDQIEGQAFHATLCYVWSCGEVKKLPSVARFEDPRPWLAKNIRVTEEEGGHRLRFTFRDGTRAEQAAIINAFLRANLYWEELSIKNDEEWIGTHKNNIVELEKRIKSTRDPQEAASLEKGIQNLRSIEIPACQADIARRKQFVVIRWAK